ncbi:MAG: hypothetical protein U0176_11580 [Bacteroidia bacterium]
MELFRSINAALIDANQVLNVRVKDVTNQWSLVFKMKAEHQPRPMSSPRTTPGNWDFCTTPQGPTKFMGRHARARCDHELDGDRRIVSGQEPRSPHRTGRIHRLGSCAVGCNANCPHTLRDTVNVFTPQNITVSANPTAICPGQVSQS